ncbi:FCSD flavin-binding domain-containing protein [Variovorax boronicumulans]|uniref:FCSD flavin-binding domain-containing protein n=1 Tax=Variovorax boronicumulans TaxID=436515 RepID=UPI0033975854
MTSSSNEFSRRAFIASILGAMAAEVAHAGKPLAGTGVRIGIVGAGVGGLTAARYLLELMPRANITVFESGRTYHSCFKSNEALGGLRPESDLRFGYENWARRVRWVQDTVTGIESGKVLTQRGTAHAFDRIVVATGVQFRYEEIEGLSAQNTLQAPHAWGGEAQFAALRSQLLAMPDNGLVVIAPPPGTYKCPPGPFERASLVAHFLRKHKPKAKLVIADANETFSKQPLFQQGWERLYGFGTPNSLIERISGNHGGKVVGIDAQSRRVKLGNGETLAADVCNLIPPQHAGAMLTRSGLANEGGWCPVDKATMASTLLKGVHVVGDVCDAATMPKSAFSASSQAKVCAFAIANELQGQPAPAPQYMNACFSLLEPGYAISIAHRYGFDKTGNRITQLSGGLTAQDASEEDLSREAQFSEDWFRTITRQLFGPADPLT